MMCGREVSFHDQMKKVSIIETTAGSGEENSIVDEFYQSRGGFTQIRNLQISKYKKISTVNNNSTSTSSSEGRLKSALKKPKTPGLGVGGAVHLPPLHVEDVNGVSNLLHRVTLQSGSEPIGAYHRIQTPTNTIDKATHMGEIQLQNMMESNTIKDILHEVLEVHTEINNFAQSLGHRQQATKRLEEANKLNLKLFQRMISEILMLHRQKFQSQTTQCATLEKELSHLQSQLLYLQEELEIRRGRIEKLEYRCLEFELLSKAKDTEIALLSNQVTDLQKYQEEYFLQLEKERISHESEQEELKLRYKTALNEERSVMNSQRHEMILQLMRENELYHQSMLLQDERQRRCTKPTEPSEPLRPHAITATAMTQTEVDDFGLWHKQDGWMLPISGTIIARNQWKRASRFAVCPSCKGVGRYLTRAATQFHKFQRGELENEKRMKEFRTSGKWVLPDELVQFMSNLPKTIEGSRIWPLSRCIRFWWSMLSLKMEADDEDDKYGYGIQNITQFIIETFLLRTESRQQAEMLLYHLMRSIREHVIVKRNPFLHTFARFLGALDGPLINDEILEEETADNGMKRGGNQKNGLLNQRGLIRVTSTALPTSILTVYIFARNCLLLPYRGEYATAIATAKSNSEFIQKNHRLLQGSSSNPVAAQSTGNDSFEEDDGDTGLSSIWSIELPDHVCVLDKFQLWIPLDRAVFVTRAVLQFLSEKYMTIILKHVESMAMFLSTQGVLEEADGNHTVIRAAMRRFQDMTTEGVLPQSTNPISTGDSKTMVVNMDKLLQASVLPSSSPLLCSLFFLSSQSHRIIELLLGRVKSLEDQLKKHFVEGDDNGDGVLSFNEFLQMMKKLAPQFPQRKILRMFREALMRGKDDAHIDQQAFVEVCKQHGLAQLVDISSLKKTVLSELYPQSVNVSKETKPLVSVKSFKESSEAKRNLMTLSEVAIASNALRRVLGRQPSQSKSQITTTSDESDASSTTIRRNLSEEVQTSSKEITEKILSALIAPDIRKTSSEELFPALRQSAQILEEIKSSLVPPQKNTNQMNGIEKRGSVPKITLPLILQPKQDNSTSRKTHRTNPNTNTGRTTHRSNQLTRNDGGHEEKIKNKAKNKDNEGGDNGNDDGDDDDGLIVPLSSIRKSFSQTPQQITPQLSPKKTPRQTPRVLHPPIKGKATVLGPHHLINSADIISLAEIDSIDSIDTNQPTHLDPSSAMTSHHDNASNTSSQILFGDDEPDLSDI